MVFNFNFSEFFKSAKTDQILSEILLIAFIIEITLRRWSRTIYYVFLRGNNSVQRDRVKQPFLFKPYWLIRVLTFVTTVNLVWHLLHVTRLQLKSGFWFLLVAELREMLNTMKHQNSIFQHKLWISASVQVWLLCASRGGEWVYGWVGYGVKGVTPNESILFISYLWENFDGHLACPQYTKVSVSNITVTNIKE